MAVKATTYDSSTDYQKKINEAVAAGDYTAAAKYEQARNAKIQGEGLNYAQTSKYASYLPKEYNGVEYDSNTDYMKKLYQALGKGDYTAAAQYEQQRNAKIDGEGLSYAKTNYTYTPQYDAQINELFDKLLNRESFSYNAATDPLYQQYKEQYVNQGKLAMQDTMGQAAALTGGYGSSYSQAVGQQQYDAYLQKLNEVVPELYQLAYSQYQDEGDALKDQYSMYLAKDAQDYERAQANYAQLQNQMSTTADQVQAILEAGGTPSEDLVLRSGLSDEYVQTLKNYYAQQLAAQNTVGSTYNGGGGDDEDNSSLRAPLYKNAQTRQTAKVYKNQEEAGVGSLYKQTSQEIESMSRSEAESYIRDLYKNNYLTLEERNTLIKQARRS